MSLRTLFSRLKIAFSFSKGLTFEQFSTRKNSNLLRSEYSNVVSLLRLSSSSTVVESDNCSFTILLPLARVILRTSVPPNSASIKRGQRDKSTVPVRDFMVV